MTLQNRQIQKLPQGGYEKMTKIRISKRLLSLVLCIALLMSYAPLSAMAATRVPRPLRLPTPALHTAGRP